jgi:hypothetical protein
MKAGTTWPTVMKIVLLLVCRSVGMFIGNTSKNIPVTRDVTVKEGLGIGELQVRRWRDGRLCFQYDPVERKASWPY